MSNRFSAEICKDAFRKALSENEYTMDDKCYVEIGPCRGLDELRGFAATTNMERLILIAYDLKGIYQFSEAVSLGDLNALVIRNIHFGSYTVDFVCKINSEYERFHLVVHKKLYLTDLKEQKKNATHFLKRLGRYSIRQ